MILGRFPLGIFCSRGTPPKIPTLSVLSLKGAHFVTQRGLFVGQRGAFCFGEVHSPNRSHLGIWNTSDSRVHILAANMAHIRQSRIWRIYGSRIHVLAADIAHIRQASQDSGLLQSRQVAPASARAIRGLVFGAWFFLGGGEGGRGGWEGGGGEVSWGLGMRFGRGWKGFECWVGDVVFGRVVLGWRCGVLALRFRAGVRGLGRRFWVLGFGGWCLGFGIWDFENWGLGRWV